MRRQRKAAGEQLSFDDLGGWRFFACTTNARVSIPAAQIDHHHRLRGGAAEEAVRQLKSDFAMNHAPVQNFFGNWRRVVVVGWLVGWLVGEVFTFGVDLVVRHLIQGSLTG